MARANARQTGREMGGPPLVPGEPGDEGPCARIAEPSGAREVGVESAELGRAVRCDVVGADRLAKGLPELAAAPAAALARVDRPVEVADGGGQPRASEPLGEARGGDRGGTGERGSRPTHERFAC